MRYAAVLLSTGAAPEKMLDNAYFSDSTGRDVDSSGWCQRRHPPSAHHGHRRGDEDQWPRLLANKPSPAGGSYGYDQLDLIMVSTHTLDLRHQPRHGRCRATQTRGVLGGRVRREWQRLRVLGFRPWIPPPTTSWATPTLSYVLALGRRDGLLCGVSPTMQNWQPLYRWAGRW